MTDAKTSEIPNLTVRDKELIERHKKVKQQYSLGSKMAEDWGEVTPHRIKLAETAVQTIISSNILPSPAHANDTQVLVSLSSNTGLTEKILAEKLGASFTVISSDLQKERLPGAPNPIIADASFLPVKPNSVSAMIDFQGAIWHEAYDDLTKPYEERTAENLLDIFSRLRTSLRPGGVIIVDDPEDLPDMFIGTGKAKIDLLLRRINKNIEGFEVSTIGKGNARLRVFKKVP